MFSQLPVLVFANKVDCMLYYMEGKRFLLLKEAGLDENKDLRHLPYASLTVNGLFSLSIQAEAYLSI